MLIFVPAIVAILYLWMLSFNFKLGLKTLLFLYFLIPSAVNFLNIPSFPLISLRRVLLLITLLFFISKIKNIKKTFNSHPKISTGFKKALYFLYFGYLLVSFTSGDLLKSSLLYTHAFFLDYLFLPLAIYFTFREKHEINAIINVLIASFTVISIYGLSEWLMGYNPIMSYVSDNFIGSFRDLVYEYNDKYRAGIYGRIQSTFTHPISYGAHLSLIVPLLFYKFYFIKNNRYITLFILVIILLNIILTNSRSPIILVFIILLPIFFYKIKNLSYILILPIIFLILLEINPSLKKVGYFDTIYSALTFGTEDKTQQLRGSTIEMRQVQLLTSLYYFQEKPFTGHGATKIREIIAFNSDPELKGAESFIFELLIETGIVGFAFFGFLLFQLLITFYDQRKQNDIRARFISFSGLFLVIGYIVFITVTGKLDTMLIFFLVAAILLVVLQKNREVN